MGKILGLDITDESMAAVLVKSGMQGYQVTACSSVSISEAGGLDEALAKLLAGFDHEGAVCISDIPSDLISYRSIEMPFVDEKKIRQTLAFEIEPMMAAAVEDLAVDFTVVAKYPDKANILAAAVKKTYLTGHLEFLQSHKLDPDVLDIRNVPIVTRILRWQDVPDNGLFLNIGVKRSGLVFFLDRRIVLIRKVHFDGQEIARVAAGGGEPDTARIEAAIESFCNTVQRTINAFGIETGMRGRPEKLFVTGRGSLYAETAKLLGRFMNLPAETIDLGQDPAIRIDEKAAGNWQPALMNNALALAARDNYQGLGFNFRQEEFGSAGRFKRFRREIRKAAVILSVIISLLAADVLYGYSLTRKRYRELDNQITGIFSKTFPEVTKIVDPVQQMRAKINELQKSAASQTFDLADHKAIDVLADISQHIPQELELNVTRMILDLKEVQISGVTDTFNTVDSIKKSLEAINYFKNVTISTAKLDRSGQGIQFEIRSQF